MATIKGVLLDVDGTLVDSNDVHAQAWLDAFAEFGHTASWEQVRQLIGMGGDQLMPRVIGVESDSPEGKRINECRSELLHSRIATIKALPGIPGLLERMREEGLRLVAASSAQSNELEPLLEIAQAKELIQARTSSSDADKSKPEPDIFQAALDQLDMECDEVVILGDTPYDLEAANKARIRMIALRSGGFSDANLAGAIEIYDDPADLLARYDESILARAQG